MGDQDSSISSDSVKLAGAKGLNAALVFGGTALFTRLIGADELGIYFLFERLLALFVIFSNFGLSGALEKRLSEGTDRGEYLATTAVLKLGLLVVLGVIILASQAQINSYLGADIAILLLVALTVREAGQLFLRTLRGEQRVGETSYLLAIRQIGWVGIGASLSLVGLGHLAPLYGFLAGLTGILVLGYVMVDTEFGRPSMSHAKSLFSFSKYDFVSSSIGWEVYNSLDTLLIGLFLTKTAVTHYEIAWRVSTVVMIVTASISKVVFPSFSKFVANGEHQRVADITQWSISAGLLVSIPALAGVAVVGESLLRFGFGPETTAASFVLLILVADKISHAVQEVLAQVVRAFDRPDICAGVTGASILVNAGANYYLIPRYGILGAGIGTTGSFAAGTLLYVVAARRFVTIRFPWRTIGWQVFSATVMWGTLVGLKGIYGINSLLDTALYILLGVIVYGGLAVAHKDTRALVRNPSPGGT
ncbi:oligosaccharide flippase family protein [Haloarcula salinisoli]|uniref:Oligosaccharide flippase family protein n=1 Tax=Haloarcula salinisoli TaxID=2487746 RepID=A0A8J7YHL4_9EURY|nr:oligosaccharide flippase family protein [Halomicroarcula salinisoli]MBX0286465.1 oligosaccharide flippase family protein [Halomicroarcula salinisoli]MBX0302046.1 oligosaccharide flippase family protein [Halomicroarcula salinisoli]